ncbi:MAG: TraB/GumN family protein [Saprospiraceae bacterium]
MASFHHGLAWQIQSPNTTNTCYLIGSMHAKTEVAYTYFDSFKGLIDKSHTLALEANIHEGDPAWIQEQLLLPDGQHLRDLMKSKKYEKARRMVKKAFQLDLDDLGNHWPMMLTQSVQAQVSEETMPQALDEAMLMYAQQHGKTLVGIESYQDQIGMIRKIPIKDQLEMLKMATESVSRYRKQVKKLERGYQTQDIAYLYQTAKTQLGGTRKWLLNDRNHNMADRIAALSLQNDTTFVVGAAHLAGKQGVLRLLKQKGLKLIPLDLTKKID